jgi:transposase
MAFREVSVVGIKEILRLWLRGHGQRTIARSAQLDRKTVRRYVAAAEAAGLSRSDGEEALTDDLLGAVVEAVRPGRPPGDHGRAWEVLSIHRAFLEAKLEDDLQLTTVHRLFVRHSGEAVPYRTLHRFCVEELGHGGSDHTVRVDDSDPGEELQVDFGRMELLFDPVTGRRRVAWALIFTAVFSRHMFVWLTFTQGLTDVIAGFEAAWGFFGGVFKVVIVDNFKAIVIEADAISPRLNDGFLEYAQSRGFVVDPARVASPQDKPRVERSVAYVRKSFFKGEDFLDLPDAQIRAERWLLDDAGLRIHGTTQRRPLEVFRTEELASSAIASSRSARTTCSSRRSARASMAPTIRRFRGRHLTLVPRFSGYDELNSYLRACCIKDLNRTIEGKVTTVGRDSGPAILTVGHQKS